MPNLNQMAQMIAEMNTKLDKLLAQKEEQAPKPKEKKK